MPDLDAGVCSDRPFRRVLIVDDNVGERTALARLLELKGYQVRTVGDGASALSAFQSDRPFNIVLTDLRLPDLDGREVALRAGELKPRPLVALMTGWDVDPDSQDLFKWRIDQVFIKPIDTDDLISRVESALGTMESSGGTS
jgi:DNA-binding response OmpR family regulator